MPTTECDELRNPSQHLALTDGAVNCCSGLCMDLIHSSCRGGRHDADERIASKFPCREERDGANTASHLLIRQRPWPIARHAHPCPSSRRSKDGAELLDNGWGIVGKALAFYAEREVLLAVETELE